MPIFPARRFAPVLLVAAFLLLPSALFAQIADGARARIDAEAGTTVNVRREPAVRSGNIVAAARAGDAVVILESADRGRHVWYRLSGPNGRYEGWVRGDLVAGPLADGGGAGGISVGDLVPVTPSSPMGQDPGETISGGDDTVQAAIPGAADAPATAPAPATNWPPFADRTDWTRNLPDLHEPVAVCAQTSSAQPARVLTAFSMARGLVNVLVRDSSLRDWDCIVRLTGGTPLRYDPLTSSGLLHSDRTNPTYLPAQNGRPEENPCFEVEPFVPEGSGLPAGWILHPTCN